MRSLAVVGVAMAGACGGSRTEAAPRDHKPTIAVAPIAAADLCVTHGAVTDGHVADPTMRGFALGAGGDAAALTFTYRGEPEELRALAGGQLRRQVGLKLRAQDSCNVVYVMWRLDPRPKLDVSVKLNPGKHSHEECGADGYAKVKPHHKTFTPLFEYGTPHTLRAEIVGDELYAWIDDKLLWQGTLPKVARTIKGPAGIRSDNIQLDVVSLAVPHGEGPRPACKREGSGE